MASSNKGHNGKTSVWAGKACIQPGIGAFRGHAGDNREHAHYAHQLSVAVTGTIRLRSRGREYGNQGMFIAAGTPHQLIPGEVLSVYLDPTTNLSNFLFDHFRNSAPIFRLPTRLIEQLRDCFLSAGTMQQGVNRFQAEMPVDIPVNNDQRLQQVLARLGGKQESDRNTLADLVGLSESRFSHWFREQTGMPLRSYRKWLRLIQGLEQVLSGKGLTEAAHQVGFADQAHFSRTFRQMFGLRPSDVIPHVSVDGSASSE